MEHPLVTLRENAGISRRDLAILAGMDYHAVYEVERGYTAYLPGALRRALVEMGIDLPELEAELLVWRRTRAQEIGARMEREAPRARKRA